MGDIRNLPRYNTLRKINEVLSPSSRSRPLNLFSYVSLSWLRQTRPCWTVFPRFPLDFLPYHIFVCEFLKLGSYYSWWSVHAWLRWTHTSSWGWSLRSPPPCGTEELIGLRLRLRLGFGLKSIIQLTIFCWIVPISHVSSSCPKICRCQQWWVKIRKRRMWALASNLECMPSLLRMLHAAYLRTIPQFTFVYFPPHY